MEKVKLVIGLGNPGKEYEKTYHNVGFLAINYLVAMSLRGAKRGSNPINKKIASVAFGDLAMTPLLKSDVFMNQSGNFVKATLKKYKIRPEELLIIHDDSDIELGKYKLCFGRGSAGHKGVQSIIDALNTKNFWRLRIGIRHELTQNKRRVARTKASELVLKKITKRDLEILEKVFEEILNNLELQNKCFVIASEAKQSKNFK
jgi:PTH1 family peptidyl-tRNA hydrolase